MALMLFSCAMTQVGSNEQTTLTGFGLFVVISLAILAFLLFIYYAVVFVSFFLGDFNTKEEFLTSLIPFGWMFKKIKEKWDELQ